MKKIIEWINRNDPWWWLVIAVLILTLFLIFVFPNPYMDFLRFARDGILITLLVTCISFILMTLFGFIGGIGRTSDNKFYHFISSLYVEIVRGIPLLVHLIIWYFCLPYILQKISPTIQIDPLFSAILAISFCYGAYMSEIVRAGIESVPKEQIDGGLALGLNRKQNLRYVILPQGIRNIIPPAANEFISLMKDSSLVSTVAVADLTRRGREYMSANINPIETWLMVALIYLIMTLIAARFSKMLERHFSKSTENNKHL
ncbi:MAG: amino acid ABC transporter permease [Dehalococcoidales bacterium]|nr:amino acid ABC transporter permease [Dehalococcoidales bacterium]